MIGQTVSHYRITSKLGEGGMGAVYRATDSKLGREVALKVLPEAFAKDAERMARFQREAQILASLNHPNIAAIYGLEESGGIQALAMELVEGPTLAELLQKTKMEIRNSKIGWSFDFRSSSFDPLPIAKQIAEGLEAAHERGIIHRDLKPANIKITPGGTVKLLDFGLAKALDISVAAASSPSQGAAMGTSPLQDSPTLSMAATQAGVILGTAAYMSPEQARGKPVDRRADIWSFGCVLFEMLGGRQPFEGDTVTDVLAAVVSAEPDWEALPAQTPRLRVLIRRCLIKDPKQRLRDIGEARIAIEETLSGVADVGADQRVRPERGASRARGTSLQTWQRILPWGLVGLMTVSLIGALLSLRRAERLVSLPVERFALTLPAGDLPFGFGEGPGLALSPDGTKLVYAATRAPSQLHLRRFEALQATPMPGTERGQAPFFSPDGQWIGFFADNKLKKVSTEGGPPVTLADAPLGRGGSWALDGTIVFSPSATSGLMRLSDGGGNVETLTTPDAAGGQRTHRWPEVLPGGKAVLFLIGKLTSPSFFDDSQIAVLSLDSRKYRVVLEHAAMARYAATTDSSGYIIYAHSGDLFALPVDLKRLEVTGRAVPVVQGVSEVEGNGAAHFALSRNGSLIYCPGGPENENGNLIWLNRKGDEQAIPAPPRPYSVTSLSPDGKRVAVNTFSTRVGALGDIEIYDFAHNTLNRRTFTGDNNEVPIWTPDGKRVAFYSARAQNPGLYREPADGSQPPQLLTPMASNGAPTSFSPDGKFLAFIQQGVQTGADIWVLPLEGERKPRPFAQERFNEGWASFSPDGRWLAYMSDESGQGEIYVRPFPGPGGKWQVSSGGGNYPVWARSGRELFYVNGDKLMTAPVETSPTFSSGTPHLLFVKASLLIPQTLGLGPYFAKPYDADPDGKRFLVVKQSVSAPTQINVVLNWFEELKKLAAEGKR